MSFPEGALRAAIYTRVSRDKRGTRYSVEEQEHEGREVITREQWTLTGVWSDNDLSASQYARKGRPDWERLLQAIEAGEIDVLVVWEPSRATRDRQVWAALAALCQERCVLINASGRTHDPNDPDDMFQLDLYFALAIRESATTRKRVQRSVRSAARKGRPHSFAPYGYRRIYDVNTGALLTQVPREPQATIVREIIARTAAGESPTRIAKDLNRRDVTAPGDEKWTGGAVRRAAGIIRRALSPGEVEIQQRIHAELAEGRSSTEIAHALKDDGVPVLTNVGWTAAAVAGIASNPRYVGQRVFQGEVITTEREGGLAEWPALVGEKEFNAAQRARAARVRFRRRPGSVQHLLTGVALCDVCRLPMGIVTPRERPNFYTCKTEATATSAGVHVSRSEHGVDQYIRARLFARLSRPDAAELYAGNADADEAAGLREAIAADEQHLEELYEQAASPDPARRLSPRALATIEPDVQARITANRERLASMEVVPLVRPLIRKTPAEVEEAFDALEVEQQKEVIRNVMEIRILPAGRGRRLPIEETVELEWKRTPSTSPKS